MSTIIKVNQPARERNGVQATAFNFDDMADRAKDYLAVVKKEADNIVATARAQARAVQHRAVEEGRQAGMMAADQTLSAKLDEKLQTLLPALNEAVEEMRLAKHAWLRIWERQAVHLAGAIAEKVIRRQLDATPEITVDLIRESLELVAGSAELKLHLNPTDYETLGEKIDGLCNEFGKLAKTDIIPDAEVTPGGCIVFTEHSEVDQRIESQLARIEEELT